MNRFNEMTDILTPIPESLIIRPATETDFSSITKIYAHYVTKSYASFELNAPSEQEMKTRWHALQDQKYPWLVITQKNNLMGYAYASAFRSREGMHSTYENSIYLAPAAIGKGLGRMLLSELVTQCHQQGSHLMVAMIGGIENQASIKLHKSVGYQLQTILPQAGKKFNSWVDVVMMTKCL